MIDLEMVDRLFEVGRTTGAQVQFRIFDKRVLLPLPQLLDAASHAAGQTISEAELRIMAGQGWVPLLRGAGDDGTEEGAPLYAPDRIGLFVKLQQQGYSTDELRLIAEYEEAVIDDIVTVDDLAYADDDLDTLLLYAEARIDALEHGWREDSEGVRIDSTADLERARREVRFLQGLQAKGVPDHLREKIEKHAFRVRALNEMFRLHLVEIDRAKVTAGYSPGVVCESHSWSPTEGFKAGRTVWEPTVKSALACSGDSSEIPAIRVPGFLLRGDRVISTKTLRPGEYAQRWKDQDLDGYLECWLRLRGDRRCLNCLTALPQASDERKQFCSDKCRNAAKQRRHREHNPDSVERAHRKYWQSLDS